MSIKNLKTHLEFQFELICFYDIADILSSHGEIFKIFKKHHREYFTSNQRLVFYTAYNPSQIVFDHIQRAATKIDISNCFIMICTPHDIAPKLSEANKKYGRDDDIISYYYSLNQSTPINLDKIYPVDTFCPAPFGTLNVVQSNSVNPCCKYKGTTGPFNHESFFSEKITQLRKDIKNQKRHDNCKNCWDVEDQGGTSLRQHFVNKHLESCDHEWIDNIHLRDLSIVPASLCNFKCRICGPTSSTSIATEELKFSNDPITSQNLKTIIKNSTYYSRSISDTALHMSSLLTNLHILGGEPFLWPDLEYLLDKLIDTGVAGNIQVEFSTNGSKFPTGIINKLLKFKSVEILISIDDIGQRFELQRGGDWKQVLTHIQSFKKLQSSTFKVKIAPTVNIQNLLYLDQLVDFCSLIGLEIVWWYLEYRDFFSINNTTQTTKNLVYEKYSNHPNAELRAIANRVINSKPVDGTVFLNYMKKIDQRRGQDSSIILKEIFDAMSS